MATFSSHAHGTPSWVDLMSPDPAASKSFYSGLFGWDADDQFDPDGNYVYTMFRAGGAAVAGLGAQAPGMEGMPAVWNTYVSVDDVDAAVAKVGEAGGAVMMPPMQVFESGRMAICADPTGAAISMWQPMEHIGVELGNVPNSLGWNELMTRDIDAALPFYSTVFGWQYDTMPMPQGDYHVISGGENGGLGGLMAMPDEVPEQVPNHWAVYFIVDDVDAMVTTAQELGAGVMAPPMAIPGVGTISTLHDAQFGSFCLMQPEQSSEFSS